MSHLLDLVRFEERLVLLEHFANGSRSYCAKRRVGSTADRGDDQLDRYWSWLKGTVGAYALESAIKFRVLCDTVGTGEGPAQIVAFDREACEGSALCEVQEGQFPITLRELSNKIIHAINVVPVWTTGRQGNLRFRYWSGCLELSGSHNRRPWRATLNIPVWAAAMQRFLHLAESSELTSYVGQDWYPKQRAA